MRVSESSRTDFAESRSDWTSQNDRKLQKIADQSLINNQGHAAMNETNKDVVLLMNSLIIRHQGGSEK